MNTPVLRAMAEAMVPATQRYGAADWAEFEAGIARALAPRPPATQRQFNTFLTIVNLLAVPMAGASLVSLPPERRERLLHRLERAPVPLIRRGVWGTRTMIFLGHYTRPTVSAATGWRGTPQGWKARPDAR